MASGAPRCFMTGARLEGRSSSASARGVSAAIGGGVIRGRPGGGGPMRRPDGATSATGIATAMRPRTGRAGGPGGGPAAAPLGGGTTRLPLTAPCGGGTSGPFPCPLPPRPLGGRLPAMLGGAVCLAHGGRVKPPRQNRLGEQVPEGEKDEPEADQIDGRLRPRDA